MAADPVDISGMPDPKDIGLDATAQADPTAGMPEPEDLYRKYYFGGGEKNAATGKYGPTEPIPKDQLDEFMANPPKAPTLKGSASMLTGVPGAINKTVGGSVAGAVGFAGGAAPGVGAMIADPTNFAEHAQQAREGGRQGATKLTEGYNDLTDSLSPWQTKKGKELGDELTSAPGKLIGEVSDSTLGKVLPDNAYQMVTDIGKDVGTVAPILGVPELGRGLVRGAKANVEAAKAFVAKEKASVSGEQPAATAAAAEAAKTTPDVGSPVTGDQLRNQPNPIPPPEGTVAAAREAQRVQAAPKQTPAEPPAAPAVAQQAPAGTVSPGDTQRGSVRLFNAPKDEGPQETPAPETVPAREQHLNDLDKLSGGALPSRRTSALTGDYNATGNDWQSAKVGNEAAQRQLASENDALHAAMDNVHKSTGSLQPDSVDPTTLGNRGQIVRGAIQGIEDHFNKATDNIYDAARASTGKDPMPNFLNRASNFLADDANYMPEGFRRAAQARLQQLKTSGDAGIRGDGSDAAAPSSVGAAEKFREWLNANRTLDNMHTTKQLVNHTDMDVAEHGGPGLFRAARAQRTHQAQMLEEPAGIKKLLAPGDSQGINHAVPEHKVMDYINGLDREQHEHVMNVLRAGAHLSPELAESSAAAIREIQAHTVSRLHDAATNEGGKWNARDFYNASSQYARNAASTFKDRPDIVRNLKTINDAGNTLHMDKTYPGAVGQAARSGILTGAVKGAGAVASSLAHEIPVVGRIVGRGIEGATEAATGDIGKRAAEKAFEQRTVDRNGKQRGSVQVMNEKAAGEEAAKQPGLYTASSHLSVLKDSDIPNHVAKLQSHLDQRMADKAAGRGNSSNSKVINQLQREITYFGKQGGGEPTRVPLSQRGAVGDLSQRNAITHKSAPAQEEGVTNHLYGVPDKGGGMLVKENPERGVSQVQTSNVNDKGKGWGTRMLQRAADDAHARGQVLHSDQQVSEGQAGAYKNLAQLGYDVKMKDNDVRGGARHAVGDHVFEVRPPKGKVNVPNSQRGSVRVMNDATSSPEEGTGSQLNIGLHQGTEGEPGFKKMSKQEAQKAVESTGAKVTKSTVLTPQAHGVAEPTAVLSTDRPLSAEEMKTVLAKTKQSAIPQRTGKGDESMHVSDGHEQIAREQGWDMFNPDYFREHTGQTASEAAANPQNIHPGTTVRESRRSAYPGIYTDPKDIVSKVKTVPESSNLKDVFGTTRQQMHDDVVKQGDVAPKTPMPGMAPKGKGSADAQKITTPENADRIKSTISAFKDAHPEAYHGMVSWYHMDPMFNSIKKILGGDADRAGDVFHKLNTYTALASPMSSVGPEIVRGTAAAQMAAEGKFNKFEKYGGNPSAKGALKNAPELKTADLGVEGHAFHGTAQAPAMSRFNESGQEANAPKTGAYRRASDAPSRPGSEYQNTVLVGDSHFSRGAGLADVRGAKAYDGSIEGPELKTVHPWYHENVAKPSGIPATSAQAVQWAALSHETGVETPIGAPKLEIWADQIAKAAKQAGVEPKEMWERIVKRLANGK